MEEPSPCPPRLNESPRPKAGKWVVGNSQVLDEGLASMKVPARRRGSIIIHRQHDSNVTASMKVPARRRGNELVAERSTRVRLASMKVPARRRGNGGQTSLCNRQRIRASMKVPARRRGNHLASGSLSTTRCLNESPRPKAGKCTRTGRHERRSGHLNESPRPMAGK